MDSSVAVRNGDSACWVLNLDAEEELAVGGTYRSSRRTREAVASHAQRATRLLGPGDVWLRVDREAPPHPLPRRGRCWCPTPSALALLADHGIAAPPAPTASVLRRVSHRSFYLALGGGAPGARYVTSESELQHRLARPGETAWVLKRPYGAAGRHQRRVGSRLSGGDRQWLAASLRRDGLVAEPLLVLRREFALHGLLGPGGDLTVGDPCVQEVDARHTWVESRLAEEGDLSAVERAQLLGAAQTAARALAEAGYFGPFGIDAYRWEDSCGNSHFAALGELNARFTMGFAVGMSRRSWRALEGA